MRKFVSEKLESGYIYNKFDNVESWTLCDKNNNMIHNKTSKGYETFQEFDENSNITYARDDNPDGESFEQWWTYDENEELIYFRNSDGYEWSKDCEDSTNNLE